jgi:4-amino-4-deoxy-L-arabinose transferase-like glycosyltransferase
MFSVLLLIYFFQLNLIFLAKTEAQQRREALVKAIIVVFTTIAFSTELLSYFYLLKTEFLIGFWAFLNIVLFTYLKLMTHSLDSIFLRITALWKLKSEWFADKTQQTLFIFLLIIYFAVLVTALFAPPNTSDALTYHLPRVAQWIQAGSVDFFPTSNDRQLYNPPLTEYCILHLQILFGSDRLANLVQFFGYFMCGVVTSLISQRFNLDRFGQLLTFFISTTIPLAIVQASSSKNDVVVSFLVAAFFYFFLKTTEENLKSNFIFAGLSLGLALLTKGNAFFFCLPIGVLLVLKSLFPNRFKPVLVKFLLNTMGLLLISVTLNLGHYYRNWQMYQSPVRVEERVKNEQITLPILFSNVVRNYVIHFGTSSPAVSDWQKNALSKLLGDELENPDSTMDSRAFLIAQSFEEDYVTNPLHLFFLSLGLIYVFFKPKQTDNGIFYLSFSIILGFILFCALLKWNYWIARLQLPFFFLGSSLTAFFIVNQMQKRSKLIIWLFFIGAFFTLYLAQPRSLIPFDINCVYVTPRSEQYSANNLNLDIVFKETAQVLKEKNAEEIGLDLSTDYVNYNFGDWEYPFWVFLKEKNSNKPILRHVGVENPSRKFDRHQTLPEWVISTKKSNIIENVEYQEVWKRLPVRVLQKKKTE